MPTDRVDRDPPFKLSMTVDFFGHGGRGLYTPRTLDLMMREARRLGGSRVYWQYLGDLEQSGQLPLPAPAGGLPARREGGAVLPGHSRLLRANSY